MNRDPNIPPTAFEILMAGTALKHAKKHAKDSKNLPDIIINITAEYDPAGNSQLALSVAFTGKPDFTFAGTVLQEALDRYLAEKGMEIIGEFVQHSEKRKTAADAIDDLTQKMKGKGDLQ
jgi:hypothetical protein